MKQVKQRFYFYVILPKMQNNKSKIKLKLFIDVFFDSSLFLQIARYIFCMIQKIQSAKDNLIKMNIVVSCKTNLDDLDESDQEALHLFNNLNPTVLQSEEQNQSESPQRQDPSAQLLIRLNKIKRTSKNHIKKLKRQEKKMKKHERLMMDMLVAATTKKQITEKYPQQSYQHDYQDKDDEELSQQFDSLNGVQNLEEKLNQLNPNFIEEEKVRKRLRKSNRKSKFEQKQGFQVQQLGLNPIVNFQNISNEYGDDYTQNEKRKMKKKNKAEKKVLTNEQIMNSIKNHGVVESEGEQQVGLDYDNGLNMLYSMKDNKKNGIKISNRMFGDINVDSQDQQSKMLPPQNLQLELKPKTLSISQQRLSFLSKAETIKKQRGMEAEVNQIQYNLNAQQKVKKSIVKMVSSFGNQQFQDQIDLQVKIPAIARGKSADIINNTEYLKRFMNKSNSTQTEEIFPLRQSKSEPFNGNIYKANSVSRAQLFKQMQQQTRLRRSKYISDEQIKKSFKKTNLQELQQARKRIQEKKRKDAFEDESESDSSIDQSCLDDEMRQLIEKQEFICGDLQEQVGQNQQQHKSQLEELCIQVNLQQTQRLENNIEKLVAFPIDQVQQKQQQKKIDDHNQIIDELASASQHMYPEESEHYLESQHNQKDQHGQQFNQQESIDEQSHKSSKFVLQQCEINNINEFEEHEIKQMEEQGITLIKNRKNKIIQQPEVRPYHMDQHLPLETTVDKQNSLDATNKIRMHQQVQINKEVPMIDGNEEQFNNFRKLRKIALVIAHKKEQRERGRKYAQQFIQNQAQEGSDNEDHDDMVKRIDYEAQEKQYDGMDLDQDLIQLIDNAVDINEEDQHQAFRKYLQDVRIQDRDQIKKIIRGQFKRKHEDIEIQVEEDEKQRQERMNQVMNWIKQREDQEGDGLFAKDAVVDSHNSDEDDSQFAEKEKIVEEIQESQSQRQPMEEQNARLDKFLEDILPPNKKQFKLSKLIDFGPLPESIKLQKSAINKTISLSRFGGSSNQTKMPINRVKKTSSLINQILNKSNKFKMPLKISMNKSTAKR